MLPWIDPRFVVLDLHTESGLQGQLVRLRVNFSAATVVAGRVVFPDPRAWLEVRTTVLGLVQPLVLGAALAAAWPGPALLRLRRVLVALLLGLLLLLVDLPVTLDTMLCDYVFHGAEAQSLPARWNNLLTGGGRLGLGAVIAALAVAWQGRRR